MLSIKDLLRTLLNSTCSIIFFGFSILSLPITILLYLLGWRVLNHHYQFGHLGPEPDAFVKDRLMGKIPKLKMIIFPPYTPLISRSPYIIYAEVNTYLLKLWKQHFYVIDHRFFAFILMPLLRGSAFNKQILLYSTGYYADNPRTSYFATNKAYYENRPLNTRPLLTLPDADIERGWKLLQKNYGLSKNSWFVCFHARDSSYFNESKKHFNSTRNVNNIESYRLALEEVTSRGGWCIRLGSKNSLPLPSCLQKNPNIIDYTKSNFHSDFMDVFLLDQCKFLIGSVSGPQLVAGVFGTPSIVTNIIPLSGYPLYPFDLGIFKMFFSTTKKRLLTFNEMFKGPAMNLLISPDDCIAYQLELIDSTADEIHEAVLQMFRRKDFLYDMMDGQYQNLQKKFMALMPQHRFTSSAAKVSIYFLQKYEELL